MKIYKSNAAEHHHSFIYGYPGCGKTKFLADYHRAGQSLAVVAGYNSSRTLESMGVDCPIIVPSSLEELIAIVQMPEEVEAKVINSIYPGYQVKTWGFDVLKDLQMIIFGDGATAEVEVFDGAFKLPASKGTGVMSLPNSRDDSGAPSPKDYRILDMRLRSLLRSIEQMNYHTIVTAHAEKDWAPDTKNKLTGDPRKDASLKQDGVMLGYPALEGWSAKSDISGLAGEMFLYLESPKQTDYFIYPKPHHQGYHARTQIANSLPPRIDWTNKNAYELIEELITKAKKGQK